MSEKNLTQKVSLDSSKYVEGIKKANTETKSATTEMNKSMTENSKVMAQNESQVKKWGQSVSKEFEDYGKKMKENIGLGARALTLDLGSKAIKKAASDAVEMAFSFSKAFAEIKSRSNASEQDLQKWKKSIMQISGETTANMDSMAESFKDMFSSVKNPDELLKIMGVIGNAAAMGDGDATKVSGFVKSTLQGQGRAVNLANVNDVLGASDVLRRNGNGFKDIDDAMEAMGSVSGQSLQKSKLSEKELASIMAGATKTGSSKENSIKAISDLISISNNGLTEGSVLASVLGTNKLTDKSGKFDISKLGTKGAYQRLLGYGGGDENKAREVFSKISGLSAESSDAIFNMVKNFDELNGTVKQAGKDQKKFSESAEEAKDNLVNAYSGFKNKLITGVTDIVGGFEKPFKSLLKGNIVEAMSETPGAIGKGMKGVAEHPGLVGAGLLTVAGGGMLLKNVLSKIGIGGGLASGVAEGKALEKAGITPVYVVNGSEIGKNFKTSFEEAMNNSTTAATGAGAKGMGLLGKLGMVAGAGLLGAGAGSLIDEYATDNGTTNKYGQKYNVFEKGMAKLVPESLGGMSKEEYEDTYGSKSQVVKVEIDVKHPGFMARPTAADNARDARVQ